MVVDELRPSGRSAVGHRASCFPSGRGNGSEARGSDRGLPKSLSLSLPAPRLCGRHPFLPNKKGIESETVHRAGLGKERGLASLPKDYYPLKGRFSKKMEKWRKIFLAGSLDEMNSPPSAQAPLRFLSEKRNEIGGRYAYRPPVLSLLREPAKAQTAAVVQGNYAHPRGGLQFGGWVKTDSSWATLDVRARHFPFFQESAALFHRAWALYFLGEWA